MTRRTFLSNIISVQSDCPHRERFGYGGDIAVTSEAFLMNFDMAAFYNKAVRDWQDAALPNGMLTDTAPFVGIQYCGVAWAMVHPLLQADLEQGSLLEAIEQTSGGRMVYTRDAVQAGQTDAQEAHLFQVPEGHPVLRVRGITCDQHNHPVRLTQAVYRGDKFRLVVKSTFERTHTLVVVTKSTEGL